MKKLLSILFAGCLVISMLSACTTNTESSSTASTESKEESSSSSEQEVSEEEEKYFDGDVEISAPGEFPVVIGDMVTISVFTAPHTNANSEFDSSVNKFSKWYEDKTNVKLDFTIVTSADKTAKLNTMFFSDSYEDVIFGTFWDSATQYEYGSSGFLVPLNDYLEEDAYYLDQYLADAYAEEAFTEMDANALVMQDGNVYSLGQYKTSPTHQYVTKIWIYEPWLDAVGMDMPTTTDEYYDVLTAFKTQDPNGNGEADEIPLSGAKTGWNTNPIEFIMNSFLYYDNTKKLSVIDGTVEMQAIQDEYKAGLEYMNMLVEEGLYFSDTYTQDAQALITLGSMDTHVLGSAAGGFQTNVTVLDEEGDWLNWVAMPPLEGPEGVQYAKPLDTTPYVKAHITDACDYPRVAFKVLDGLYEAETVMNATYGLRGEIWEYAEDGELGFNGEQGTHKLLVSARAESGEQNYAWAEIGVSFMYPGWMAGQVSTLENVEEDQDYILYQASQAYAPYAPDSSLLLPSLNIEEEDSVRYIDLKTQLNDYINTAAADFILNGDIDERWDTYLAEIDQRGLEEYLEICQKAYDALVG
ncbi:MAG: hypothetical protein R3Y33_04420 [Clostridia bacterium]